MIRRILLITQDFPPQKGGIQTYCKHLAIELHKQGFEVTVICPRSPSDESDMSDIPADITVNRLSIGTSWLWLPLLFKIVRFLKKYRPDVIIYGQWQCGIWHLFYPKLAKRYTTATLVHGRDLLTGLFRRFSPPLCARVLRTVSVALPNSLAVANLYVKTISERIGLPPVALENDMENDNGVPKYKTVNPGIDASRFIPVECGFLKDRYGLRESLILATVTRLVGRKNVASVIRLLPRLKKQFPNLHYVVGGSGPERKNLEALAHDLQIRDAVTFTGEIAEQELVAHMSMGDVFVLPSTQDAKDIEGFGIVFLEAACCGVPQVAFPTGGIPDAVAHNVSGLLCERADDDALYATLTKILESRPLRTRLGEQGRIRAQNDFSWELNAQRIVASVSSCHSDQLLSEQMSAKTKYKHAHPHRVPNTSRRWKV